MQEKELQDFIIFLKEKRPTPKDDKFALDFSECVPEKLTPEEALTIARYYFDAPYFKAANDWDYESFPFVRYIAPECKQLTGTVRSRFGLEINGRIDVYQALQEFEIAKISKLRKAFQKNTTFNEI